MGLGQIIDAIWNLPWYKALIIAAADDVIIMLKLWPLWLLIVVIVIVVAIISRD